VAVGAGLLLALPGEGRSVGAAAAWVVGLGLGLLPALVLTVELVRRTGTEVSPPARTLIGAGTWAGWCLFVAFVAATLGRLVILPGPMLRITAVVAVAGAGFALVAFDGHRVRLGRGALALALVVLVGVVLGSLVMAGRWGNAV
jgi:hypothetical protein